MRTKNDGKRNIVESHELLSASWSWKRPCGSGGGQKIQIVLDHRYNFIHSKTEYARNR